jgi:ketosteroid isomerase-like protein
MSDETARDLAEFLRVYEERTNGHRFEDLRPLIAEDAVYWFSDGSFTGREAIQQAIEATWELIRDERYAIEEVHWIAVGTQVAVCLYTFRWRGVVGEEAREGSGRGTSVLRRDADQWRVVHEHLSPTPPEPGD